MTNALVLTGVANFRGGNSSLDYFNFLWHAVTTYIPLKHLSLAAPLSAWNHWWTCDSASFP
jgi:hypothetical protein